LSCRAIPPPGVLRWLRPLLEGQCSTVSLAQMA
jgi:hypothetical protein